MRINSKAIVFGVIVIVVAVGIYLSENIIGSQFTNGYLSTKSDNKTSFVYNTNYKKTGKSESFNFGGFDGKWSLIEINAKSKDKVTLHDNTKVTKGRFCIVVLDPNYKIIGKIEEKNEESEISFKTDEKGKYIIRIVGENASGKFDIKVNSPKGEITHKDFM
ncbi:hypothetical protein [Clostridium felsineum]|uniref:Uncharacterized protein n=1 Tax=Clostridium felsineum TaxID=36839 RepID=A0A1S8LMK4_9CLOT|nr:hypothetical protein [Clostridium felsineum]MCR3760881.1 hypothetical protein [Clostridium felsineum]URZ04436.1 hypothetical protein CLAUR_045250 [Clostridium felsineum]URZ07355.1 hypothetical protein CLROS_026930 [Clostridium felsineum]URZ12386.1 hypothetical protein CROST_031080 [Clostridium felsineum]